jgi:hypothetical protein
MYIAWYIGLWHLSNFAAPRHIAEVATPQRFNLIMETLNSWINLIQKRAIFGECLTLFLTEFNVNLIAIMHYKSKLRHSEDSNAGDYHY